MATTLADSIFKLISLYEHFCTLIKILLKVVSKSPVNNMLTLVQIMILVPSRRQAIIWTDDGPVYYHIYVSLELNDLKLKGLCKKCKILMLFG